MAAHVQWRLLTEFATLFVGSEYNHRPNNQNDALCRAVFEDLYALGRSLKFRQRCDAGSHCLSRINEVHGVSVRHGDGAFGERVPSEPLQCAPGFAIGESKLSTLEIGVEVKVTTTALKKNRGNRRDGFSEQIDAFKTAARIAHGRHLITLAIAAVNAAPYYVAYEGLARQQKGGEPARVTRTTGSSDFPHPIQHHDHTVTYFKNELRRLGYSYDLVLAFSATNDAPFAFSWVDPAATVNDYTSALTNMSVDYDRFFP